VLFFVLEAGKWKKIPSEYAETGKAESCFQKIGFKFLS
jgi:hypothetical protein